MTDQQQAVNALLAGEIDMIEQPAFDLIPLLAGDKNIKLWNYNPLGLQYTMRFNHTQPPFDNPKVRQAVTYALNQKDFLEATVGNPDYYQPCKAMFVCGTPLASEKGMEGLLESNFRKSQELLKEAGYDGKPIVLLHSTDLQSLTNLGPSPSSCWSAAASRSTCNPPTGRRWSPAASARTRSTRAAGT